MSFSEGSFFSRCTMVFGKLESCSVDYERCSVVMSLSSYKKALLGALSALAQAMDVLRVIVCSQSCEKLSLVRQDYGAIVAIRVYYYNKALSH